MAWNHVDACNAEVKYHWDDGEKRIYYQHKYSVQLHGHGENHIFAVNDVGNVIRNPNLKKRNIVCNTKDGVEITLSEYPSLDKFAPPPIKEEN